jgi:hypothetical protein
MDTPEILKYRKRITLLGALGMPFAIALALGSAAHFRDIVMISILDNPELAFNVFLAGVVGVSLQMVLAAYCVFRIKSLKNENT